jgi:hypothetical protein
MSMMGYLGALSARQVSAFRGQPRLASDYAAIASQDLLQARLDEGLARLPPDERAKYEAAKRDMMARVPEVAAQQVRLDAARSTLAQFGPFESILDLSGYWNVLHYLLTGHVDASAAPGDALLTGEPLGDDLGYGPPRLHGVDETRAFRDFLAPLDAGRVIARMDLPYMAQLGIYPLTRAPTSQEAQIWREDITRSFTSLKDYVGRAAERGEGLLVWIS